MHCLKYVGLNDSFVLAIISHVIYVKTNKGP